jgi:ABC-type multidrug transport system fused ATPase/permease subunit
MIHVVRDKLRTGFEKIDRVWSEVTNVLADTIPGIRVVKAFAQEKREAGRFHEANRHNLVVNDKLNATWSLFTPTVSLLTEIGLLVVWAFGIWLVAQSEITVGVLTAFIAYIGRFYTRLDSMSRIVSVTQKAAAGAKRIFDILDHVSNVPEPEQPVPLAQPRAGSALRLATTGPMRRAIDANPSTTTTRPKTPTGNTRHRRTPRPSDPSSWTSRRVHRRCSKPDRSRHGWPKPRKPRAAAMRPPTKRFLAQSVAKPAVCAVGGRR